MFSQLRLKRFHGVGKFVRSKKLKSCGSGVRSLCRRAAGSEQFFGKWDGRGGGKRSRLQETAASAIFGHSWSGTQFRLCRHWEEETSYVVRRGVVRPRLHYSTDDNALKEFKCNLKLK